MVLNLVLARKRAPAETERLSRTVSPDQAAERREAECAATVPEKRRRESWIAGFEQMMAAYVNLALRDLRD
jgi:hypothetical protein